MGSWYLTMERSMLRVMCYDMGCCLFTKNNSVLTEDNTLQDSIRIQGIR